MLNGYLASDLDGEWRSSTRSRQRAAQSYEATYEALSSKACAVVGLLHADETTSQRAGETCLCVGVHEPGGSCVLLC